MEKSLFAMLFSKPLHAHSMKVELDNGTLNKMIHIAVYCMGSSGI